MIILYGLKNCDTCRKASAWLTAQQWPHRFHDLRAEGLDPALLAEWERQLGWETLLNRKSTAWRQLPEADKAGLDRDRALILMQAHPTLIKRPILMAGTTVMAGFTPERYAAAK